MRKDCKIDNRVVIAPNASTLAGGRVRVKRGDCFTYSESGVERVARSLGRVSAPALRGDTPTKGFVLALVASSDFNFGFERWVNPQSITRVFDSPSKFAAFFFAPSIPYDAETVRALIEHGTICERYISNAENRVAEMKATESAT